MRYLLAFFALLAPCFGQSIPPMVQIVAITPGGGGGGSGTVTSFSAGTLSPLFTTSVATATTTPALSFALSNATANTIFGRSAGTTGAPAYNAASGYSDAILGLSGNGFVKRTGANTYTNDSGSYQPLATNLTSIGALADANGFLLNNGSGTFSYTLVLPNGVTSTTQTQGDNSTKVATTAYVDAAIADFEIKDPVVAATTAALPFSPTYSNGSSGVGATLTGSVGILAFDGYTPVLGDRLLIKNQASTFQNGVYTVTTVGTALIGYVLTRATDFNQTANILYGDSVGVLQGTTNANQQFTMNNQSAITVGTTAITFAQTSGGSQLIPGTGITIIGNTVAVDTTVTATASNTLTFTNKSMDAGQLTGTIAAARMPALTGDVTTSAGAVATTLATVNSNVGAFTAANITVNAKGLVTAAANGTADVGYALCGGSGATATPGDATTYYLGANNCIMSATTTTEQTSNVYIPKAGTVKVIEVWWYEATTNGSNESFTISFRLNATTDTAIASVSNTNRGKRFSNTGLSITVAQGDFFQIKVVTPTWATNPTGVTLGYTVYIE